MSKATRGRIYPLAESPIGRSALTYCVFMFAATAAWADGQIDQGRAIAQKGAGNAAPCISCHGANGEGMAPAGFPYLAGMPAQYLQEQLNHFANETRKQPVMAPMAKALSESQRAAVAAYYASLDPVFDKTRLSAYSDTYPKGERGAWLAQRGDEQQQIPACVQCHGPGGIGVPPSFPPLAGQSESYLKNQLMAWKSGSRGEDPHGSMAHLARKLTDEQIADVSRYFSQDISAGAKSVSVAEKGEKQ